MSRLGFGIHHMDAVRSCDAIGSSSADAVRAAREADLGQLSDLNTSLYQHLASPPVYLPPQSPEFTSDRLPGDDAYTAVAEVDGRVVGFISCRLGGQGSRCLQDPLVPHINGAYLLPGHRGGTLAPALLDSVLAWAREKSCSRVTTDFETANVEGSGFWLGSGFRPVLTTLVRRISS
jgi:GNAT superfamily N-acetyltransferase